MIYLFFNDIEDSL